MQSGVKNAGLENDSREMETREIDQRVAKEIFGYEVFSKDQVLHETYEKGVRPLRNYTKEMDAAWIVAEKMRVSLIPIENGSWFAFIGPRMGWSSPEAFLEFLKSGDFSSCGAAVGENPAQVICEAALVANQKQKISQSVAAPLVSEETPRANRSEKDPSSLH